jgi:hypothetical protein
MDFNDRATGDAAILVAGTQILIMLGTSGLSAFRVLFDPVGLISALISALFFWLMYTGATYAIVRYLFDGEGSFPTMLRITGFAYPTLLVLIATDLLLPSSFSLALLVGGAWFVVVVANGVLYVADLPISKAFLSAVGGFVLVIIIQSILSSFRLF